MVKPVNFKDLTDQRFEAMKLTVVEAAEVDAHGHQLWRCRRDDGKIVLRTSSYLTHYQGEG